MSDPYENLVDRVFESVFEDVSERFVERVAEACATRLAPVRCPHCGDFVHHEADPCVACPHCGTELVLLRADDQSHVFRRSDLEGGDVMDDLERFAEAAERRRNGG